MSPFLRAGVASALAALLPTPFAVLFALQVPPAAPPAAAPAQATEKPAAPAVAPRKWEHESSDLKVNPRIHFGALPNGLRYAWMDNSEPKHRVYLRMHVNVGSLGEEESERGMAHFLEHMAFNGSKRFPAGKLIEWLQQKGLSFGADTNASTDFSQTIYQLDLPTSDEAMVEDGLTVMRDVGDGLLLADKEVNDEKGVIDGEERERDSAGWRVFVKMLDTVFAGSRVAERIPIGRKSARDVFDGKAIRAFYERFYRPENCTVVLVGDLEGRDPTAQITKAFADWTAPAGAAGIEPPRGTPKLETKLYCIHDAELPNAQITAQMLKPWVEHADDKAERLKDLALQYARAMLNLRFSELVKKGDAPFMQAEEGEGGGLDVLDGEDLTVVCEPKKWKEALAAVQAELRSALVNGFAPSELDEVRKNALRNLDEAVKGEKTRASDAYVDELLEAAESRVVPTDAVVERDLMQKPIEKLTVEECANKLRVAWTQGKLVLGATGGLDLGPGGEKQLEDAWKAGNEKEVAARAEEKAGAWGYASDPAKAGKVAAREHQPDFDFDTVTFENGVRLLVKKTDFAQREIAVRVLAGEGRLSLENEKQGLFFLTQSVFDDCGLGKHSSDDLRRLMAGKAVGAQFGVGDDSFMLGGGTTIEDLPLECELLCAYLTDPGYREDGETQFRRQVPQMYESLKHQPGGAIGQQFFPAVYGNDPRVGLPKLDEVQAATLADMKAWIGPALDGAPLDVVVVGDLDVEKTVATCAQTFGALPKRRAPLDHADRRAYPAMKSGLHETYEIDTQIPKSAVIVMIPTTDGRDAATRRDLRFLSDVVGDRLRLEIREKLGDSYSPGARMDASLTYPGFGRLMIQAMADPAKAQEVADACLAVVDKLAKDGVTDEEVDRLRGETLNHLRDQLRLNAVWLELLGGFHTGRPVVADLKTMVSHHEKLKAADLTPLAKKYLGSDKASVAIVKPAAPPAPPAPPVK
jgi:zinc protease